MCRLLGEMPSPPSWLLPSHWVDERIDPLYFLVSAVDRAVVRGRRDVALPRGRNFKLKATSPVLQAGFVKFDKVLSSVGPHSTPCSWADTPPS